LVTWTGDWELGLHQLFAPDLPLFVLVAVVACQASSTLTRPDNRGELLTAARRVGPLLLSLAIAVLPPALVTLAGVAWVAVQTTQAGGQVGTPLSWITFQLALTMVGCIGVAAGRLFSPLVALPVAAGIVAGIYAALPSFTGFELLNLGGARGSLAGMQTNASYAVAGASVMLVVLALSLGAAAARSRKVAAALVAMAVVALVGTTGLPSTSLAAVGDATTCRTSAGVTTCVFPGYDRFAGAMSRRAGHLRRLAIAAGVPAELLPAVIIQQRAVFRPTAVGQGSFVLGGSELDAGRPADDTVASALSYPSWCPQMDDEMAPLGLLTQSDYVSSWLLLISGSLSAADFVVYVEGMPVLDPAGRTHLVIELLRATRECRSAPGVPTE
jgi:hypothetical protein